MRRMQKMMKKSLLKLSVMVLGAAAGSVWAAGSQAAYDPLKEPSGAAFALVAWRAD